MLKSRLVRTTALLCTLISCSSWADEGRVLFEDTFATTNLNRSNWPDIGVSPRINASAENEPSPPYSLHLGLADRVESRIINLSGLHGALLKYSWQEFARPEDKLFAEYWDGDQWKQVVPPHHGTFIGIGVVSTKFAEEVIRLPVEVLQAHFRIRFRTEIKDWSTVYGFYVDDIAVVELTPSELACSKTIQSYPYYQGFEDQLGDWIELSPDDDSCWRSRLGDPAYEGQYFALSYADYRPDGTSLTQRSELESPCFDFDGVENPVLSFAYYMSGSNIGTLKVRTSSDGNWQGRPIWSRSDDQGNEWKLAFVDLTDYNDSVAVIRFEGIHFDEGYFQSGGIGLDCILVGDLCREATVGSGAQESSTPMSSFCHASRTQVIYLADEIGQGGVITALALDVQSWPDATVDRWTIRMKHTNMDSYTDPKWEDDWQVTFQEEVVPTGELGWHTFSLSEPFHYNGKDNLLVDFSSFGARTNTNGSFSGTDITDKVRAVYACMFADFDPLEWSGSAHPTDFVPSIRFTLCSIPGEDEPNHPEGMVLVDIPGGTFQMGDHYDVGQSDEKPVHTVTLDGFSISEYKTTNAQYASYLNAAMAKGLIQVVDGRVFAASDSNHVEPYCNSHSRNDRSQIELSQGHFTVLSRDGLSMANHPVYQVAWHGAQAFCDYYGYRLPTEAEWEYAARGGYHDPYYEYPWGSNEIDCSKANFRDASGSPCNPLSLTKGPYSSPVGYYGEQGAYGLCDMGGNGWEWCEDRYDSDYYSASPANNPAGPSEGTRRVLRGGLCRVADRGKSVPRSCRFGFRACTSVASPE